MCSSKFLNIKRRLLKFGAKFGTPHLGLSFHSPEWHEPSSFSLHSSKGPWNYILEYQDLIGSHLKQSRQWELTLHTFWKILVGQYPFFKDFILYSLFNRKALSIKDSWSSSTTTCKLGIRNLMED